VLKPHRNHITLASKCGMAGVRGEDGVMRRVIDGPPKTLRQNCEDSLRLGTDVIDLYYLHRWDKRVPIEESVGEMARLKEEGKVRALGLSESAPMRCAARTGAPDCRAAKRIFAVVAQCRAGHARRLQGLGIAYVAFSPMGRAFLSGKLQQVDNLVKGDIRAAMPRFAGEAYAQNLRLLAPMQAVAEKPAARWPSWPSPGCCTRASM
jgi:aryl-alcohol dehydrogenase-like predicted oxidoreductase